MYTRLGHGVGILAARFFVPLCCGDRSKLEKVCEIERSSGAKKMRVNPGLKAWDCFGWGGASNPSPPVF
jgi:hypothetical protein